MTLARCLAYSCRREHLSQSSRFNDTAQLFRRRSPLAIYDKKRPIPDIGWNTHLTTISFCARISGTRTWTSIIKTFSATVFPLTSALSRLVYNAQPTLNAVALTVSPWSTGLTVGQLKKDASLAVSMCSGKTSSTGQDHAVAPLSTCSTRVTGLAYSRQHRRHTLIRQSSVRLVFICRIKWNSAALCLTAVGARQDYVSNDSDSNARQRSYHPDTGRTIQLSRAGSVPLMSSITALYLYALYSTSFSPGADIDANAAEANQRRVEGSRCEIRATGGRFQPDPVRVRGNATECRQSKVLLITRLTKCAFVGSN